MLDSGRKKDIKNKKTVGSLNKQQKRKSESFSFLLLGKFALLLSPFRYNSVQCSREIIFSPVCYFYMKNVSCKIRRRSSVKTNSKFM